MAIREQTTIASSIMFEIFGKFRSIQKTSAERIVFLIAGIISIIIII